MPENEYERTILFPENQKKITVKNISFTTGNKTREIINEWDGSSAGLSDFKGELGFKINDYFDDGSAKTLSDGTQVSSRDKGEYRQIKIRFGNLLVKQTKSFVQLVESQAPPFNIISNDDAFTVLKSDHSRVSWGHDASIAPSIQLPISNVVYNQGEISNNDLMKPVNYVSGIKTKDGNAYAMIKSNGSIISWGFNNSKVAGSPSFFSNSYLYKKLEEGEGEISVNSLVSIKMHLVLLTQREFYVVGEQSIQIFPELMENIHIKMNMGIIRSMFK